MSWACNPTSHSGKASVLCFLFFIGLIFTCYVFQNNSDQMILSSQYNRNGKVMGICGIRPSKIEPFFVSLGILELRQ